MGRKGLEPVNKEKERNDAIVKAIKAGMRPIRIAETLGISRQRVSQVWKNQGDGTNLKMSPISTEKRKSTHNAPKPSEE